VLERLGLDRYHYLDTTRAELRFLERRLAELQR
jgi:hypothetical protein